MDPRIYTTCQELLEQRGYILDENTPERIIASQEENIIYILFSTTSSFNLNNIREYISILTEDGISHAILVYAGTISSQAKKAIENLDIKLELFHQDELKYNLTKHRLVPKHTRLSQWEARDFKNKYGTDFPSLLVTDPVSKFYAFERGNVIRIDRNGYIAYRIVK